MVDGVINIRELRIGNELLYKGEAVYVSFLSLDIDDEYQDLLGFVKHASSSGETMDWVRTLYPDIQPIPLTEEVLLACNFVKDNYGAFEIVGGDGKYVSGCKIDLWVKKCLVNDDWVWDISIGEDVESTTNVCYIKYLHQLQNAYFVIHNKELNYQP